MNKIKAVLIISLLFLLILTIPFSRAILNDDVLLANLHYETTPHYSWPAFQGFGYPSSLKNVTTNGMIFQFDGTFFGGNPQTYSFKTTFTIYANAADYSGPASFGVDSLGANGLYLTKSTSSKYHCAIIVGQHVISSIDLNFTQYYDCFLLLLFNNTDTHSYPTFSENFTVYSQGHLEESAYKIASIYSSYSSTPLAWSSYIQTGVGSDYNWEGGISNIKIYKETPITYLISVSSTPINASVTWEDAITYDLPHNFSASAGLDHWISATAGVNANVTTRYIFEGWSIDGSPTVNTSNPLVFFPIDDMTLQAIYSPVEIPDWSKLWTNFGIGLIGLIMMFLSWFVGYWIHREGDTPKGILIWFVMFIVGYGFFTVLLGG